jgi:hypothetical protein
MMQTLPVLFVSGTPAAMLGKDDASFEVVAWNDL